MDDATKVEVTNQPLPVRVIDGNPKGSTGLPFQNQQRDPSLPAQTTFQQDLTQAGQRNINYIWESTQGQIAKYVILGTMFVDGVTIMMSIFLGKDFTAAQGLSLGFVNSLATGVVSFYFSRTNHTQVGGVGPKIPEMSDARR